MRITHQIQVFIAKTEILLAGTKSFKHAHVIPLEQGFSLLPIILPFQTEVRAGREKSKSLFDVFQHLTLSLEEFGANLSQVGDVAYLETRYADGRGTQAALLWRQGRVFLGPLQSTSIGPISNVLKEMGVERNGCYDEFDALKLYRYRENEDWIRQPVHAKRSVPDQQSDG